MPAVGRLWPSGDDGGDGGDQYQLRMKTLNKVMVVMSTQCQHHDNDNNAFEEDGERDNCEYNDIMMSWSLGWSRQSRGGGG